MNTPHDEYKAQLQEQIGDLEHLFESLTNVLEEIACVLEDQNDQEILARLMGKLSVRWDAIWHKLCISLAIIVSHERHEEMLVSTIEKMGKLYEVRHLKEQKHIEIIEGLAQRLDARNTLVEMIQWVHKVTDTTIMVAES